MGNYKYSVFIWQNDVINVGIVVIGIIIVFFKIFKKSKISGKLNNGLWFNLVIWI
jgi:hypothetical protein